jgi:uncharacterized protein with HEPN domain
MPHDPRKSLDDMRQAAEFLLSVTAGRTCEDYRVDESLRCIVERKFEIIGEALNRLRKCAPELADSIAEHRKIVSFRNVLIHGYDIIDHDVVWRIVVENLPTLHTQVAALLAAAPDATHD